MSLGKLFTSQLKNIVRFKPEQQQEVANPFEDLMKNIEPLHKKEEQQAIKLESQQDQGWALEDEGVLEVDTPQQFERIPSPRAMPEKQPTSIMVQSPALQDPQSKTVEIKTYNELPSMTLLNNTSQKNSFQQDSKKFLSMLGLKKNDDKQGYLDRVLQVNLQLFQMQELAQLERAEQINQIQNMKIKALEEIQIQKDALAKREDQLNEKEALLKLQQENVRIAHNIIEKFENVDQKECFERVVQENLKLNDDIQGLNNLQNQIQQDYEDQLQELTINMEQQKLKQDQIIENLQTKITQLNERNATQKQKLIKTKQKLHAIKQEMSDLRNTGIKQFQTALHKTDEIKELVEQTFSKYINPILKKQSQEFEFYAQEHMQKLAFKDDEISQLYEELDKVSAVQLKEKEEYNLEINSKKKKIINLQEEIHELKTIIKENDSHSFRSIDDLKNKVSQLEKQLQDQQKILAQNREYSQRLQALGQSEQENIKLKEQVKKLEEDIKNSKKQQDLGSLFSSVSSNQDPANSLWGLATKGKSFNSKTTDQYEKEIKSLQAEIQELKHQIEGTKKIEPEEDQWGLEIDDKNEAQNMQLLEKENEINEMKEELTTKDKEIQYLLEKIKNQQKTLEQKEEQQNQQQQELDQLVEQVSQEEKKIQIQQQRIQDLEQLQDAASEREKTLETQLNDLRQELSTAAHQKQTQEETTFEHKIEEQQKQIRMLTQELERVNSLLTENQTKELDQEEQMQKLQYFLVDAEYNSNLQKNKMQQEIHDLKLALEFAHQEVRNSSRGISSKRKSTENDDEIEHQLLEEEEKADSDYEYPEEENGWRTDIDQPFYQGNQNSDDYYQFEEPYRINQEAHQKQQIEEKVEESDDDQKEVKIEENKENTSESQQIIEYHIETIIEENQLVLEQTCQVQADVEQFQQDQASDMRVEQVEQFVEEQKLEVEIKMEDSSEIVTEVQYHVELQQEIIELNEQEQSQNLVEEEVQQQRETEDLEQQQSVDDQNQNIQNIQQEQNDEKQEVDDEDKGWTMDMDIEEMVEEIQQVEEEHKDDLEQAPEQNSDDQIQSFSPAKQELVDAEEQNPEEHKDSSSGSLRDQSQENMVKELKEDYVNIQEQTEQKNGSYPVEQQIGFQEIPEQKLDFQGEGWDVQDDNPVLLEEEFKNEEVNQNAQCIVQKEVVELEQGWEDIECTWGQNEGVDDQSQKSAPQQASQNILQNNMEWLLKQPKSDPLPQAPQNNESDAEKVNEDCGWGDDIDLVLDEDGEENGITKDASTTQQQDQEY